MSDLPVLDAEEQRVLGSLLEKQLTVPASYPLTLNSLRLACNQSNSRTPVVSYDDALVQGVCKALKDRGLLRVVWAGAGSRTLKYHQLLDVELSLQPDERALVTVLLLRGPQSPGELKTRTERLYSFAGRAEVEAVLTRLATLPQPVVRELPLRAGQQDRRWVHVLGPVPDAAASAAAPADAADRESVLAGGAAARDARVIAAYDAAAAAYSEQTRDALAELPFDVWLLERVASLAQGPIADLGCGPGHVAAFLADTGAEVHGFDASPALIEYARADYDDLPFEVARFDQFLRPRTHPAWGAVVAWYAFVHLAASELAGVLTQVARTLRPGDGVLACALLLGDGVTPARDVGGPQSEVDADVVLHERGQVLDALAASGLVDVEWYELSPAPGGPRARRLYVLARPAVR